MIKIPGESLGERLCEAYASQHARCGDGEAAALTYRHNILSALPQPIAGPVLDTGCSQGHLVKLMLADGYDATGIDVSPEQVALARAAGLDRIRHAQSHLSTSGVRSTGPKLSHAG